MRILAAGDIHNDCRLSQKLADKAVKEKVDLVILCGDLTLNDQPTKNLVAPFVKAKKKILLIPGNHETIATADFLAEIYGAKNIHGYSVKYEDIGIFGCGGANIGLFQLQEDEIFDLLKQGHDKIDYLKKKIMVSHVHPSDSLMEKFTEIFPGSTGVTKAIEEFKPDIMLCSHVHEAEGIEEIIGKTKIINVGKTGKIIDI
ncbi:MAG: metallophosphoesterase family protein [Candidatus Woesearchaeota archaeon]